MKFECHLELKLICDEMQYVRYGGADHRDSYPTVLKEIKKLLVRNFYCGDDPNAILNWSSADYCRVMGRPERDSIYGMWEIPYISIFCESRPENLMRTECPAHEVVRTLKPLLKEFLRKWDIDPLAYDFEVNLWDLQTEPDYSYYGNFDEEDENE